MTNRFLGLDRSGVDFGDRQRDVGSLPRDFCTRHAHVSDARLPTQFLRDPRSRTSARRWVTSKAGFSVSEGAFGFMQMLRPEAKHRYDLGSMRVGGITLDKLSRWIGETTEVTQGSLEHALEQLGEVHEDAAEEGLPEPSQQAMDAAEQLLRLTYNDFPNHEVSVYPDDDGSVCIYAPGGKRWSFLMICAPSGGILCSANRPQRPWQVRFSDYGDAKRSGLLLKALHDNELGALVP